MEKKTKKTKYILPPKPIEFNSLGQLIIFEFFINWLVNSLEIFLAKQ